MKLLFDLESNGLLDQLDTIHCIVACDLETGTYYRFNDRGPDATKDGTIKDALAFLEKADLLAGHNLSEFDLLAIQKVYPGWRHKALVRDTLIMSRLIYADLKERDFKFLSSNPEFPKKHIGRHSLEAWGSRLGFPKDDYAKRMKDQGLDPWAEWSQEMEDYCAIDVELNVALWHKLAKRGFSEESIQLEHDVRRIVKRQEDYGFLFDQAKAAELYGTLTSRREELKEELCAAFPPFFTPAGRTVPKQTRRVFVQCEVPGAVTRSRKVGGETVTETGYYCEAAEEAEYTKVKLTEFNPASRDHIANRLKAIYGWKPKAFTGEGKPQVDESILSNLSYPAVKLLSEYLLVTKRIGQLAEGKEAWLKQVKSDGRMHGRVNTNGAVTGRMTHSGPNMAQVPASYSLYGKECRELFTVPVGKKLVGMDADALELRCLAGYMARWDGGEYIRVVLDGDKKKGTDIHSRNQRAIGLNSRDVAKTWFYGWLYGAGDYKLGTIIAADRGIKKPSKAQLISLGKESRAKFQKSLPALGKLVKAVQKKAKETGQLRGLDGRILYVRAEYSVLNTLLQGAGAILMKKALVLADEAAQARGWIPGKDYEFVLQCHDETQAEVNGDIGEKFGRLEVESLKLAGESFGFRCPIDGQYKVGDNWSQTH